MPMDINRTEIYRLEEEFNWFGDVQFPRVLEVWYKTDMGTVEIMRQEWYRDPDLRRVSKDWDELAPEVTHIVLNRVQLAMLKEHLK